MPKDKHPPYFPFYVDDFINDGIVDAMTTEEQGAYLRLLCKAWKEDPVGSVPDDDRVLAQWARLTPCVWSASKPNVMAAFRLSRRDGRYHQRRMESEWAKLQRTRANRSKNAQNAAIIRHSQGKKDQQDTCESHAPSITSACATENENEFIETAPEVYVCSEAEESQKEGLVSTKGERQMVFDEHFQAFKGLCLIAGEHGCLIAGDEGSWRRAWFEWSALDPEQKLKAIAGIRTRVEMCLWDDAVLRSLPSTVLAEKKYGRPIPRQNGNGTSKMAATMQAFAILPKL